LCKLHIGALGTLGIITQLTLKLKPRPERSALAAVRCPAIELERLFEQIHHSRTRPVCVTALNDQAARLFKPFEAAARDGTNGWLVLVGFEDNAEAVLWQVRQLQSELSQHKFDVWGQWSDVEAEPVWQVLADFPLALEAFSFKATVPPRHVAGLCALAASFPENLYLQVHAGNGVLFGHAAADLTLDRAQTMLRTLLDAATAAQGNVTVQRCPEQWKASLPIWGAPRGDIKLMRAIKDKLDPRRIFNPGRFVDGL